MVTGVDLVKSQIRVAAGEKLTDVVTPVEFRGHAIECRINAEEPFKSIPSAGRVTRWVVPSGEGVRMDSHIRSGSEIPSYYDSLAAKLIVRGDDRPQCIERLKQALGALQVEGINTNRELHSFILNDPGFEQGGVDIHFLEKLLRARESRVLEGAVQRA
jgi:acetyl-CoA carboxylase, biotin carboxylase subunit